MTFLSETFRVGSRTVTMTLPAPPAAGGVLSLECAWFPDPPLRLSRAERRQYVKGRARFLTRLAKRMGERVLCVDL